MNGYGYKILSISNKQTYDYKTNNMISPTYYKKYQTYD